MSCLYPRMEDSSVLCALCAPCIDLVQEGSRPLKEPPKQPAHAPWQVYKFERLQPLSYYASAEQRDSPAGAGLFWRADPGQEALVARCRMLRRARPPVQGCDTGGGHGIGHAVRRPARVWSGAPTLVTWPWSQAAAVYAMLSQGPRSTRAAASVWAQQNRRCESQRRVCSSSHYWACPPWPEVAGHALPHPQGREAPIWGCHCPMFWFPAVVLIASGIL